MSTITSSPQRVARQKALSTRMPKTTVIPVLSAAERRQFLQLPWLLHRQDPHWIPPLRTNQKELVGYKKHPFWEVAEGQTFLALRDGRPVGRILAHIYHEHNRKYDEKRGFFGFFESIDDAEVAAGLFDAARGWLRDRGVEALRGPLNPAFNYEIGLLIEGFDSSPAFMMTYNPPYYGRLIEEYGFRKCRDLYAFYAHVDMLESTDQKLRFVVEECQRRFNLKMRRLNTKNYQREVEKFLEIFNRSNIGHWGHVPLTQGELKHLSAAMKWLVIPELTCVAEVDGEPIGAVWALLDYNPIIRRNDGRLFPLGWWRLLRDRRKLTRCRLLANNVIPEYQKWGVGLTMMADILPLAIDFGMQDVEFSWIVETNHLSRKSLERGGAKRIKTYRVYDIGPEDETINKDL